MSPVRANFAELDLETSLDRREVTSMSVQRCIYLVMWPHSWPQDFFFFMQKYSNQGISCKYIQIRVFYAEILVRYRYALPSHARLTIWIGHGCNVYSFSGSIDQ